MSGKEKLEILGDIILVAIMVVPIIYTAYYAFKPGRCYDCWKDEGNKK